MNKEIQYVYLLQEREFVNNGEQVYKVGNTKQCNLARFSNYPRGSILYLQIACDNSSACENEIIKLFKSKYIHRKHDIGNEYFQGDPYSMIDDIIHVTRNRPQVATILPRYNQPITFMNCKQPKQYICGTCKFNSVYKHIYDSHCMSQRHLLKTAYTVVDNSNIKLFECKKCQKTYLTKSGLWRHKNKCIENEENTVIST